jgi:HK97 family phage major capsid protein
MDIQEFLTQTTQRAIPVADLTSIAATRAAQGDDVIAGFRSQAEQRTAAAQAVLDAATQAGRDSLLASEQRSYDAAIRERDSILALQQSVERRTEARAFVPTTQTGRSEARGGLFGVELRALVENTGAGGVVVPDDYRASFFDRLAATSVMLAAGAQPIRTNRDTLKVPRIDSDPTAAIVAEGGTISPSDPGYTEISATPVKIATLTVMSNEMIADSNPSVLKLLEMQVVRALALKYDLSAFEANDTNFKGLKNTSGITLDSSLGANGSVPSNLDVIASAVATLQTANASATAIFMHPRTWGTLCKIKEQTSGNNKPLLQESGGSGSQGITRAIYGVPVFLSSQLSITETKGSSTDCSSIYVADMSQIVPVFREDARIEVDSSRLFNSDQSELRAIMRATLAVPNAAAVVRIEGVRA